MQRNDHTPGWQQGSDALGVSDRCSTLGRWNGLQEAPHSVKGAELGKRESEALQPPSVSCSQHSCCPSDAPGEAPGEAAS